MSDRKECVELITLEANRFSRMGAYEKDWARRILFQVPQQVVTINITMRYEQHGIRDGTIRIVHNNPRYRHWTAHC